MVTKNGASTVQVYSQTGQLLYQSAPTTPVDGIFKNGFQQGDTNYAPQTGGNKRYVYLGRHLIADGLGSPALTTSTSGVATARNDYQLYGWGPAATSTPGFTGHVADAETGLSYMQARYYDPFAGRFLAVDPVAASEGSFNRYWYANNNPYGYVDPDGRTGCAASRIDAVCDRRGMSSAISAAAREGVRRIAKEGTKLVVETVAPMGGCLANGCTAGEAIYEAATSIPATKVLKRLKGFSKAAEGGREFYRGAKPGTAPSLVPAPNEFHVDKTTGFVQPTHGVSVFDNPSSVRAKGFVPYRVDQSSIPDSLRIIQRGNDPRHFEVVPAPGANLTPQQYINACSGIICTN
jgi:RHS repeat-associated protein